MPREIEQAALKGRSRKEPCPSRAQLLYCLIPGAEAPGYIPWPLRGQESACMRFWLQTSIASESRLSSIPHDLDTDSTVRATFATAEASFIHRMPQPRRAVGTARIGRLESLPHEESFAPSGLFRFFARLPGVPLRVTPGYNPSLLRSFRKPEYIRGGRKTCHGPGPGLHNRLVRGGFHLTIGARFA